MAHPLAHATRNHVSTAAKATTTSTTSSSTVSSTQALPGLSTVEGSHSATTFFAQTRPVSVARAFDDFIGMLGLGPEAAQALRILGKAFDLLFESNEKLAATVIRSHTGANALVPNLLARKFTQIALTFSSDFSLELSKALDEVSEKSKDNTSSTAAREHCAAFTAFSENLQALSQYTLENGSRTNPRDIDWMKTTSSYAMRVLLALRDFLQCPQQGQEPRQTQKGSLS
jgi:hypothetical protein